MRNLAHISALGFGLIAMAAAGILAARMVDYLAAPPTRAQPHPITHIVAVETEPYTGMPPNQRVREAFEALREHEGLRFK